MQGAPDPEVLIPIAGMATGLVITGMIFLGPVGRAIGDVVRHLLGGGRKEPQALPGEVDELRERLETVQHQLSELAERQDFAERMLAQARQDRGLPGSSDVAG
jgi:hypothetical protein